MVMFSKTTGASRLPATPVKASDSRGFAQLPDEDSKNGQRRFLPNQPVKTVTSGRFRLRTRASNR